MMGNFKAQRAIMKELLDNGYLLNGTIITEDGGVFKVHLEFVASMSPYLKRIIMSAKDFPFESILIPGVSKEVMASIISFMYTGRLEISKNKASDLAKAGEVLEMPHVIRLCRKHIISNLDVENCLKIYTSPDYLQIPNLKDELKPYMIRHFQQIFPVSSDYLNLDVNDLVAILSSDHLDVAGEEYVFWAIMRWVEHDPVTRLEYLLNLLFCIRFGFCNPQFYEHNIVNHPFIRNNEECHGITLQASALFTDLKSIYHPTNILLDKRNPFLRSRTPTEIIFVMGGMSQGFATNVFETFDIKSERWFLLLTTDSIPRAYHGMLWHKGYIYIIGGFDGNHFFNDVRRFNPITQIWEEKGCMNHARGYVSVAALENYIYAMGGHDGRRRSKSCERYDSEHNQWKMMADMNQVRSDASADTLNDKIYIVGGFNGRHVLNSAECYDPETDTWTAITNMSSARSGVKVTAYNNYLFAIGGFDGIQRLQTVEKYNPQTSMWTSVPDMNTPRSNFATAVMYDCLYVIGGFNGN